jgi:hypothetical protein
VVEQEVRRHLRIVIFFSWLCIGLNLAVVFDRASRSDWIGAAATCTVVVIAAVSLHLLYKVRKKWS